MATSETVLLTGATGFVGSTLTALLLREGCTVYAIVRGGSEQRVRKAMAMVDPHAAEMHGRGILRIIDGDALKPMMGLDAITVSQLRGRVDYIVHCAGNVKFNDPEEKLLVNRAGVEHMAALALALEVPRVVHLSTGYVWGECAGWLAEQKVPDDVRVGNPYERSKRDGEEIAVRMLAERVAILRPTIVVAPMGEGWRGGIPTSWTAYYGYFAAFAALRAMLRTIRDGAGLDPSLAEFRDDGSLDLKDTRIPGDTLAEINLVPADVVAKMAVALGRDSRSGGGFFHAANPGSPRYEWLVQESFGQMGIVGGRIVSPSELLGQEGSLIEKLVWSGIGPFLHYVSIRRRFATPRMGQFYDISRIPPIDAAAVGELMAAAVRYRFGRGERQPAVPAAVL